MSSSRAHRGETAHPLGRDRLLVPLVVGVEHVLEVEVAGELAVGVADRVAREPLLGDEPLDVGGGRAEPDRGQATNGDRYRRGARLSVNSSAGDEAVALLLDAGPRAATRRRCGRPPRRVKAEVTSSLGSTRKSRTSDFATDSMAWMIGRRTLRDEEERRHEHERRTVRPGDGDVLGDHLPDDDVQVGHDRAVRARGRRRSPTRPTAPSAKQIGSSTWCRAASATAPSPSEHTVMPSWPSRASSRVRSRASRRRAPACSRRPRAARASSAARRSPRTPHRRRRRCRAGGTPRRRRPSGPLTSDPPIPRRTAYARPVLRPPRQARQRARRRRRPAAGLGVRHEAQPVHPAALHADDVDAPAGHAHDVADDGHPAEARS